MMYSIFDNIITEAIMEAVASLEADIICYVDDFYKCTEINDRSAVLRFFCAHHTIIILIIYLSNSMISFI